MRRAAKVAGPNSFTLVEVLTVMAVITILIGITIAAIGTVERTAARSRARSEIGSLANALENYKSDNGTYPTPPAGYGSVIFTSTNYTASQPTTVGGTYQNSSAFLYQSLTGMTNNGDVPVAGVKTYDTFTRSQLGNNTAGGGNIYIKDPFGYSYGYFPGNTTANPPNNGNGFFDLWSTGGDTAGVTNSWIANWGL